MTAPVDLDPGHQAGDAPIADEQLFEQKEVAGLSQMQIVRRRFLRHRGAMSSMLLLATIVIVSISSVGVGPIPGWWKWEPNQGVPPVADDGPTLSLRPGWLGGSGIGLGTHPFGVDNELGRDMFAMTMKGVQTSLTIILVYGALALIIGVTVGAVAGYFGGWLDIVLMRITEVFMVIPLLVVAAVAGYAFNATGVWSLAILLGIVGWTGLSRLVRAEFLALREREFVDAARVAGASSRRIIFKHILPNSVGVIVVSMTLLMGAGILAEAALGFLGFGVQRPNISLGNLVEDYKTAFSVRPWLFLWPGVFIVAIVLSLQFIGDGLRDAFDPRQKRIPKRKDLSVSDDQIRLEVGAANMQRHAGN
ncbi:ABC transporter permease [Desertimonas flava]|jgi:peptide/nickel transport system permease protein|uniref:ABC transporter permease n=1 Tax=Desertimonas flava TaxID=2064846 RepID=UPI0013C3E62C|nr:ABC transporter permease [Desertimonas flava]